LLRSLNPGNSSSSENVSLPDLILCDEIERFPAKLNLSGSDSFSRAAFLRRNVNHLRASIVRQMRQSIHRQPPIATIIRPGS
jgi:hypothetical protein